jgi:phage terminase large subunit-like protein
MATSEQLHAVRRRAMAGSSPRLAYFEWSIDPETDDPDDLGAWAKANPALGIRIGAEFVAAERAALDDHTFLRERLGVPDTEAGTAVVDPPWPLELWDACAYQAERPAEGLVWAVDVSPDQESAAVAVAWRRPDVVVQVQTVDHRPGAGWVAGRVAELRDRWPGVWLLDPRGGSGALVAGWPGETVPPAVARRGCVELDAAVRAGAVGHFGEPVLRDAVAGAVRRPSAEGGWSWARRSTRVDISPLVAVSLAHGGVVGSVVAVETGDPLASFW